VRRTSQHFDDVCRRYTVRGNVLRVLAIEDECLNLDLCRFDVVIV
jgi:hypothetical protein